MRGVRGGEGRVVRGKLGVGKSVVLCSDFVLLDLERRSFKSSFAL